jgi:hypothetical protein
VDWSTLFSTLFFVAFVILMLRGCGGMSAGGGCGMHGHHRPRRSREQSPSDSSPGATSSSR